MRACVDPASELQCIISMYQALTKDMLQDYWRDGRVCEDQVAAFHHCRLVRWTAV